MRTTKGGLVNHPPNIQWASCSKIYIGHVRVFQTVLMGRGGYYMGFFPGINQMAKQMAEEIGKDLALWLVIYLLCRG